ncbi:xanthine dehydrogenase family protein molybdopterin-binding subunit [Paracoccus sp. M683]|uniref:xanthine dehydrogenase family protein molybdopterin-binding subunit n=1 Tax=Paracoccus sp. M683 TaxID=2594268 RepID=UPI00117BE050|nr:xanthine dehydrogenase family protein molybdopterin-binding subunit [Paracoccus sp. M683]TRW97608.1 xanthine dehydrogenase family protein molybdopterin-binding subunit [Paracoccus sp. M683]
MNRPNDPRNIGAPRRRIDGPLKASGTAPYAYEHPVDDPLWLWPITATLAKGEITRIDTSAAESLPGVELVLTHLNAPRLWLGTDASLKVLQSPQIAHFGQFIGAVVAADAATARHAAGLVRVTCRPLPFEAAFTPDLPDLPVPKKVGGEPGQRSRGDMDAAWAAATHRIDGVYTHPVQHHNPLEPHALIARWRKGGGLDPRKTRLTLWDANQGVLTAQLFLPPLLGLLPNQIEIIAPYTGGGFGGKGLPLPHVVLTILAAKKLRGRAVKYAMTRQQMFATTGHRPASHNRIRLAADDQGRLLGIEHHITAPDSRLKSYIDASGGGPRMIYAAPACRTIYHRQVLDTAPATFMRGPGEFSGMFALETAMDELAHDCGVDPVQLRLRNEPATNPDTGKPFSTRNLTACLTEGAAAFGWADRAAMPGQRRQGEWLIGMGVAAAAFPHVHMLPTRCRIRFRGGRYVVQLGASDIGTGAWTALTQIAADALSVPMDRVQLEIGRTGLALAMVAGGSAGTYSWGGAIIRAARKFRGKYGETPAEGAHVVASSGPPKGYKNQSMHAYGAHFAEARVNTVTGEVRVPRMLGAYAAGQIINPVTARSQMIGGMTMGISAALHEESVTDPRFGHVVNADFAGYHIAAHADIGRLDAIWIDEFDEWFGPTGAKGIGEIGIVGVPAAVGNAIFNATGIRLRDMPFTPDKLLMAGPDLR